MPRTILIILIFGLLPLVTLGHGDEHGELIIRMTAEGFEPRELTVTTGDEVLFINNDDVPRWPASNFHPTHTLYPEFDPQKEISPGSSWKHLFDKPGTWRMHDHLYPHMTGKIVVLNDEGSSEEKGEEVSGKKPGIWSKIKAFFSKLFSRPQKTEKVSENLLTEFKNLNEFDKYAWLEEAAEREGPVFAWNVIKTIYATPEGVVGNPHDMAHLVGQLLFKERGFEGLSVCEPIFAFGCYHGLMEVAFDKDKPELYVDNLMAAKEGCRIVGNEESPSYWSCIHGMGHGVATFREHNLPKSLKDCDLLDMRIRTYCHDGVFMEFSISAPPSFYKRDNPIYPCDTIGDGYRGSCGRSQAQVMRFRLGLDTGEIAHACTETRDKTIIYHCIDALGYFAAQQSGGGANKIIAECGKIADYEAEAQCLAAAAGELVFQDYAGWREATKAVCSSLIGERRTLCEDRVKRVKESYGR